MEGHFFYLVLLLSTQLCTSLPVMSGGLPLEIQTEFNPNDWGGTSGLLTVGSRTGDGFSFVNLGRDGGGSTAEGIGFSESGQIGLGYLGKVSVKTFRANGLGDMGVTLDTEVYSGMSSFNPLTVTITKRADGLEYSGATDMGFLGGSYVGSTQTNVIPKFEMHLDTNGWITMSMKGQVKDKILVDSYDAGLDLGLLSGSLSMDGNKQIQSYQIGGSLGLIHGAVNIDRTNNNARTYKAGLSLGVVDFDALMQPNNQKSYTTVIDTGVLRFTYKAGTSISDSWKGTVDLANVGIDYEMAANGISIVGGRIQIGSSIVNIHRDSTGKFIVKVNKGSILQ